MTLDEGKPALLSAGLRASILGAFLFTGIEDFMDTAAANSNVQHCLKGTSFNIGSAIADTLRCSVAK